jgi:hypothetical protein
LHEWVSINSEYTSGVSLLRATAIKQRSNRNALFNANLNRPTYRIQSGVGLQIPVAPFKLDHSHVIELY